MFNKCVCCKICVRLEYGCFFNSEVNVEDNTAWFILDITMRVQLLIQNPATHNVNEYKENYIKPIKFTWINKLEWVYFSYIKLNTCAIIENNFYFWCVNIEIS